MSEKKITINGKEHTASTVSFQPVDPERWVRYELSDDSVIKVKCTTMEILRVHGEHDPDGNPKYHVEFQIAVKTVESALHFQKKE